MAGNPPTAPSYTNASYTFPSDLADDSKQYWMMFSFYEYQRSDLSQMAQLQFAGGGTSVALPMPDRINDNPTVDWQSENLLDTASQAANFVADKIPTSIASTALGVAGKAQSVASYFSGQIINPFMVMLFKSPEFKDFHFTWLLSPRNEKETRELQNIVQSFRYYMMPDSGIGGGMLGSNGATLKYPYLVVPRFFPDKNLFQMKPCAIRSVNIDYTGAGMPAFFQSSQGPAQVRLTVNLTEVEYWIRSDMQPPSG